MNPFDILEVEDNEDDIPVATEAMWEGNVVNTLNVEQDGLEALKIFEKTGVYTNSTSKN